VVISFYQFSSWASTLDGSYHCNIYIAVFFITLPDMFAIFTLRVPDFRAIKSGTFPADYFAGKRAVGAGELFAKGLAPGKFRLR
jgi:hypothetical protein